MKKKPKKTATKKKPGRKSKKEQLKADVAGMAEVLALLVRHANGAFPQELSDGWISKLTEVRDRWGMQL